jgi:transposase
MVPGESTMGKRKKYTEEFKKDAVRLMLARGTRTVAEVADGLGVNGHMLHRWHQQYGAEVTGRGLAELNQQDVEALRRRVRQLEQENALLKKAAALFAREGM